MSHRTTPKINTSAIERESNEIILSSDESDIIQFRKRRLIVESDSN